MTFNSKMISIASILAMFLVASFAFRRSGVCKVYAERGEQKTSSIDIKSALKSKNIMPVVIIGSGPAALSSALYAARGGAKALVIRGGKPGGALTETSYIENWPGRTKVLGPKLMEEMHDQVKQFGAQFLSDIVTGIDTTTWPYAVTTEGGKSINAMAIILATGSTPRTLDVPGEQEYWGKGVTTCAVCDAPFCKGLDVVVVGGGDTAAEQAMQLAPYAKTITILVRKDTMRASSVMKDHLQEYPNISVMYNKAVKEIEGDGSHVTHIQLKDTQTNEVTTMPVQWVFLAIGHTPNTQLIEGTVAMDDQGYVLLENRSQQTSLPLMYAAGDVADDHYKQAGVAAGDGIKAALDALEALQSVGYSPKVAQEIEKNLFSLEPAEGTKPVNHLATIEELEKALSQADHTVILDFYADYCPSCMRMLPLVESIAYQFDKKVTFYKVDMGDPSSKEIAEKYQVKSIPVMLVLNNQGDIIGRYAQAMNKKQLHDFAQRFVNVDPADNKL